MTKRLEFLLLDRNLKKYQQYEISTKPSIYQMKAIGKDFLVKNTTKEDGGQKK